MPSVRCSLGILSRMKPRMKDKSMNGVKERVIGPVTDQGLKKRHCLLCVGREPSRKAEYSAISV